ncbi:O-antigen ligase family protein [Candidatus Dependentiae bacterium]|nr:O-antigen ligase family protein [Candidatus Dependentiae bacterium]
MNNFIYNLNHIKRFSLYFLVFMLPLIFSPVNFLVFEIPKILFISFMALVFAIISFIELWSKTETEQSKLLNHYILIFIIISLILVGYGLVFNNSGNIRFLELTTPVLFLFVIFTSITDSVRFTMLKVGLFSLLIVSIYGILQSQGIDLDIWAGNIGKKTVFSTIGNPNTAAEFSFLLFPVIAYFFLSSTRKGVKFWYALLGIVSLLFSFICQSKGAILSFIIASFIIVFFMIKSKKKKIAVSLVITGLITIGIFFSSFIFLRDTSAGNFISQYFPNKLPFQNRIAVFTNTLKTIRNNSILGVGPGNFQYYYTSEFLNNEYIVNKPLDPHAVLVKRAHNEFLHISTEFGILGLGFLVLFWILTFKGGLILCRKNIWYYFVLWAVVFIFLESFINFPLQNPTVLIYFILILSFIFKKFNFPKKLPHKYTPILISISGIILLGICILSIKTFISDTYLLKSNQLISNGDLVRARVYLKKSIKADPKNFIARTNLGVVEYNLKNYSEAEKILLKSKRGIIDFNLFFNLGMLYQNTGDLNNASVNLQKALSLNPYHEDLKFKLINIYLFRFQLKRAFEIITRFKLSPHTSEQFMTFGFLHKLNGNFWQAQCDFKQAFNDSRFQIIILKNAPIPRDFYQDYSLFNKTSNPLLEIGILYYLQQPKKQILFKIDQYLKVIDQEEVKNYILGIKAELNNDFISAVKYYKKNRGKNLNLDLARVYLKQGNLDNFLISIKDVFNQFQLHDNVDEYSLPFFNEDINVLELYRKFFSGSSLKDLIKSYKICSLSSSSSSLFLYFPVYFNFINDQFDELYRELKRDELLYKHSLHQVNENYLAILPIFAPAYLKFEELPKENHLFFEFFLFTELENNLILNDEGLIPVFRNYLSSKYDISINNIPLKIKDLEIYLIKLSCLDIDEHKIDLAFFYLLKGKHSKCIQILETLKKKDSKRYQLLKILTHFHLTNDEIDVELFYSSDEMKEFGNQNDFPLNIYEIYAKILTTPYLQLKNKDKTFEANFNKYSQM